MRARERQRAHSARNAGHVVPDGAGPDEAAEVGEDPEPLRERDGLVAVGSEVRVVVEQAVVPSIRVRCCRARRERRDVAADRRRERRPPRERRLPPGHERPPHRVGEPKPIGHRRVVAGPEAAPVVAADLRGPERAVEPPGDRGGLRERAVGGVVVQMCRDRTHLLGVRGREPRAEVWDQLALDERRLVGDSSAIRQLFVE